MYNHNLHSRRTNPNKQHNSTVIVYSTHTQPLRTCSPHKIEMPMPPLHTILIKSQFFFYFFSFDLCGGISIFYRELNKESAFELSASCIIFHKSSATTKVVLYLAYSELLYNVAIKQMRNECSYSAFADTSVFYRKKAPFANRFGVMDKNQ